MKFIFSIRSEKNKIYYVIVVTNLLRKSDMYNKNFILKNSQNNDIEKKINFRS